MVSDYERLRALYPDHLNKHSIEVVGVTADAPSGRKEVLPLTVAQLSTVGYMQSRSRGIIASEAGTGKTRIGALFMVMGALDFRLTHASDAEKARAAMCTLYNLGSKLDDDRNPRPRTLVYCPNSMVVSQWGGAIRDMNGRYPAVSLSSGGSPYDCDVCIVFTYNQLKASLKHSIWSTIIVDECHMFRCVEPVEPVGPRPFACSSCQHRDPSPAPPAPPAPPAHSPPRPLPPNFRAKKNGYTELLEYVKGNAKLHVWLLSGTAINNSSDDLFLLLDLLRGEKLDKSKADSDRRESVENHVIRYTQNEVDEHNAIAVVNSQVVTVPLELCDVEELCPYYMANCDKKHFNMGCVGAGVGEQGDKVSPPAPPAPPSLPSLPSLTCVRAVAGRRLDEVDELWDRGILHGRLFQPMGQGCCEDPCKCQQEFEGHVRGQRDPEEQRHVHLPRVQQVRALGFTPNVKQNGTPKVNRMSA